MPFFILLWQYLRNIANNKTGTTLALKEAELNNNTSTLFVVPKARLPIATPDKIINAKGGTRTAQTLLSVHSLLTIMSEMKPKKYA